MYVQGVSTYTRGTMRERNPMIRMRYEMTQTITTKFEYPNKITVH